MKARRKGSIYKEPGCSTWTIAYRRDGKRIREYTGFEEFNAALQRLAQRLAQSARGEMIDTGRGPTCADLWEGLKRYYRINGRQPLAVVGQSLMDLRYCRYLCRLATVRTPPCIDWNLA